MRVLFYTAGTTGSGNTVIGLSLGMALRRLGTPVDFTVLSNNPAFSGLADRLGVAHREVPFEDEARLSPELSSSSALYQAVVSLAPDVLVVLLHWFMLHSFIRDLPCRKIFLCRQVSDLFFRVPAGPEVLCFRPGDYDLTLAIEPFRSAMPLRRIDPIVIRNREEILPRSQAVRELGLEDGEKRCLFAFNGKPGEFESALEQCSHLEGAGYRMVYTTNYRGGLFPAVDYFNAFDMLVCGAGYNAFWEAVYFGKEALFIPVPRQFEDQKRRVEECRGYAFRRNGADELAKLIMSF